MTQITYNNANAEERTKQLRSAKVEESRIQEWSRTQFENLPQPVQERQRLGVEPATTFVVSSTCLRILGHLSLKKYHAHNVVTSNLP